MTHLTSLSPSPATAAPPEDSGSAPPAGRVTPLYKRVLTGTRLGEVGIVIEVKIRKHKGTRDYRLQFSDGDWGWYWGSEVEPFSGAERASAERTA